MSELIDRLMRRRDISSNTPICPDHDRVMLMRGKVGRATQYADQTGSEYTVVYFCPVKGCGQQAERVVKRNQAAVPGAAPARPAYARRNDA